MILAPTFWLRMVQNVFYNAGMRVQILQHVPFEGPGSIGPWLEAREATVHYTCLFEEDRLPPVGSIDLVVAMGGPMSVNDEEAFPWLAPEKKFIRDAVTHSIPVLGICLGAQLLAAAMGSKVYRNPVKEIGWFPIRAARGLGGSFQLPEECLVFHWHGETFDLPPGARRLAASAVCENQAFQVNRNAIGFQFHLETTPESMAALVENCRDELIPGPYIQSEADLRAVPASAYRDINSIMNSALDYLVSG
jgi:GMP synthase-like glutamine amidotransferase